MIGWGRRRSTAALAVLLLLVLGGFVLGYRLKAADKQQVVRSVGVPPALSQSPALSRAAGRTVGLINRGCGDPVLGTAFPIADEYLLTTAHVIAGSNDHLSITRNRLTLAATAVLFDPARDVAVLHVPGLRVPTIARGTARPGALAAVVGSPDDLHHHVAGARIYSLTTLTGRDIYGAHAVRRQVLTLVADVRAGDSGGPVLSVSGRWDGMVYGFSLSNPHTAFAVSADEMQPDIVKGLGRTNAVSTGRCLG